MAQRKSPVRPLKLSVCKIRKEIPGQVLATVGSGCILELGWLGEMEERQNSLTDRKGQIFLVTTNQVIKKGDLNHKAFTADFLPVKRGGIQTFNLNRIPLEEVIELPISGQKDISLILIPTEPLHKQKLISRFSRQEFQSIRSRQCQKNCGESGSQAAESKEEFHCYVVRENDAGDTFDLKGYALTVDESCSHYLRVPGNNSKLRKLEDFSNNEFPKGSVILNEQEEIVHFLAFGKDDEILPVFFPQEGNQASDVKLSVDLPQDSGSSGTNGDAKRDKQNNLHPESFLSLQDSTIMKKDVQNPDDTNFEISNGNRREPAELSFHSVTFDAQTSTSTELGNRPGTNSNDDLGAKPHGIQRSESERPLTPTTRKKLLKSSYSLPGGLIALKAGATVEKVIMHAHSVYVRETLMRYLDTTYTRNNENWQHLASRQGVSEDLIMRLKLLSPESRSEALFQLLKATSPDLSAGTLRRHLMDLQMKNVLECIKDLHDDANIGEAIEAGQVPGRFFILLDQRPEENWNKLGSKLEIDSSQLEGIKSDCATRHQNPAEDVIEMICASNPTMTIGQFKMHLQNIERNDVKNKITEHEADLESLTITALRDELDLMREVTRMLNVADNKRIKNFKDLAKECGIPAEKYRSLQPPCTESPTEEVLQDIVGRKPFYTVRELFIDLCEMNRKDAIEAISIYFVEDDVKALKRELQITPE